jgi:hypothetical protein
MPANIAVVSGDSILRAGHHVELHLDAGLCPLLDHRLGRRRLPVRILLAVQLDLDAVRIAPACIPSLVHIRTTWAHINDLLSEAHRGETRVLGTEGLDLGRGTCWSCGKPKTSYLLQPQTERRPWNDAPSSIDVHEGQPRTPMYAHLRPARLETRSRSGRSSVSSKVSGQIGLRSGLKAARSSSVKIVGCSQAAKCPPLSTTWK